MRQVLLFHLYPKLSCSRCAELLFDPQRGVGLACAAGHDELAPVGGLQTVRYRINGFELMVARRGCCFAFGLGEVADIGRVFQRGLFKIGQQEPDDGFVLCVADLLGVVADAVGGGDQQSMLDERPVRFAKEFIDIVFGDVVIGRIALGLHRPVVTVLVAKHQINTAVRPPALRPFVPKPDLLDLRSPFGIGLEEPFDEVLELLAALERIGIEASIEVEELTSH